MATPEYQTMVSCTSVLVNTLAQNIQEIGRVFREEGIIAPAVFETTQSLIREPKEKSQILVDALTNKVKMTRSAKRNFLKIVEILMNQDHWISDLIEELREKYEGWWNVPNINLALVLNQAIV